MAFPTFTWPNWRKAKPGTKFRDTRSGRTGTLVGLSKDRHGGARVTWDATPENPWSDPTKVVKFVTIANYAVPLDQDEAGNA